MATRSNILAWEIPWTEETGVLQSVGTQRVGHDWVNEPQQQTREVTGNARGPMAKLQISQWIPP